MNQDLLYQLALMNVPHIGSVQARILVDKLGSAEAIFKSSKNHLEKIEGIGSIRAKRIKEFKGFDICEREIAFIHRYGIETFFLTDKKYPQRLLHCYDPPSLLFYKGKANLNASKIIGVIGTRNNTDYGKQQTEKLIRDLSTEQILVISGLAFGIDAIAHKTAIKNGLPTIGVLAHGLDQVYPPEHTNLAKDMIRKGGGLLTEFPSRTKPDKHNFPTRNRIVAGLCDAIIVIETGVKGGSMITAELANGYNKDVFAFPGKVSDAKSTGCNQLIQQNKAILLNDAEQLLEALGWKETIKKNVPKQKELFIQLNPEEKIIVDMLQEKASLHIDEIKRFSNLSNSTVAATILNLELNNIIVSLPGKIYRLAN